MRCFVTGASGFLGSHLTHLLLDEHCGVGVLVRESSDLWRIADVATQLTILRGDLGDVESFVSPLRDYAPEALFHLAWSGVSRSRDELSQIDVNLHGTVGLLRALKDSGCQCFVGLGSQAEYGSHNRAIHEETSPHPESLYGAAKLCSGILAQRLCNDFGVRFVWLRLFAAYGPKEDPHFLIPSVIRALLGGMRPALTPGRQRMDYLFVQDAVRALWMAANRDHMNGVFNLGSGSATTVREIAEMIRDLIDPQLELGLGDLSDDPHQARLLQADIRRLQAAGWTPRVSFRDGLQQTIDWHRSFLHSTMR